MSRILLVGPSSADALAAALHRLGWSPLVAVPTPVAGLAAYPGRFDGRRITLPPLDRSEFSIALLEFVRHFGVRAVIPTDSGTALAVATIASALESRGIPVIGSPLDSVRHCDDRITLNRSLRPIVPTGRIEPWTPDAPIPFAAMIRPRFASLDRTPIRVDRGASSGAVTDGAWCLERIVRGAGVRVDIAVGAAGRILHFEPTPLGHAPTSTADDLRVRAWTREAVRHLQLRGVATLFLRTDRDDRPVIMDVRPHAVIEGSARSAGAIHAALEELPFFPASPAGAARGPRTHALSLAA